MMYLALSYDHRLIDGREAVTFLVRMKEALEDPTRILIDLVTTLCSCESRSPEQIHVKGDASARLRLPDGKPPATERALSRRHQRSAAAKSISIVRVRRMDFRSDMAVALLVW